MTDNLIPVYHAPNEFQSAMYKALLEEAGVAVIEQPLTTPYQQPPLHVYSRLLVSEDNALRAKMLVDEFTAKIESGELAIDDSFSESDQPSRG